MQGFTFTLFLKSISDHWARMGAPRTHWKEIHPEALYPPLLANAVFMLGVHLLGRQKDDTNNFLRIYLCLFIPLYSGYSS